MSTSSYAFRSARVVTYELTATMFFFGGHIIDSWVQWTACSTNMYTMHWFSLLNKVGLFCALLTLLITSRCWNLQTLCLYSLIIFKQSHTFIWNDKKLIYISFIYFVSTHCFLIIHILIATSYVVDCLSPLCGCPALSVRSVLIITFSLLESPDPEMAT